MEKVTARKSWSVRTLKSHSWNTLAFQLPRAGLGGHRLWSPGSQAPMWKEKALLQFQDSKDEISETSNNLYSKAQMPSGLLTDSFPSVLRQALKGSHCQNIFMFLIIKGTTSARSQLTEHTHLSLISPEPSEMYQALGVFVLFFCCCFKA